MAHAHADAFATPPQVSVNSTDEVEIAVGPVRLVMAPAEAHRLNDDLSGVLAARNTGRTPISQKDED